MKSDSCRGACAVPLFIACAASGYFCVRTANAADVTLAVVPRVAPSPADELASLPTPAASVPAGSTFYAEIWAQTTFVDGLSMVSTDVGFDATRLEALSVTHTDLMDLFANGSIDNVNGRVNDLSGSHSPVVPACSDQIGVGSWARIALVEFRADVPGATTIDLSPTGSPIYVVSLCGLLTAPTVDFLDASITVQLAEVVDVTLVPVASPGPGDTSVSLPTPLTQVILGDTYFAEIWARTTFANGLSMVSADVSFDPAQLEALSVTHSALMSIFGAGTIDNVNGLVDNFSGSHVPVVPACSDHVGTNIWARVGSVQMRADAVGTATIDLLDTGSAVFVVALCGSLAEPTTNYTGASVEVLDTPPGIQPEPNAIDKVRFISFSFAEAAVAGTAQTAIRVRLVSLHHVMPGYLAGPSIPFTAFEGQVRWAGPPVTYMESASVPTPVIVSQLQCTPHYRDWSGIGVLHVTGDAIVPSSIYRVEQLGSTCVGMEASCMAVSAPLQIGTQRWADVAAPFGTQLQPNFIDVSALVDKFKEHPLAIGKARGKLQPNVPDPQVHVNFLEISACVDAFKGQPYPYPGPSACP